MVGFGARMFDPCGHFSECGRFDEGGAQVRVSGQVNEEFLKAIDLALSGEWNAAHQIVQQYEDETAAWIHAVLHKIEGDQDNSRYWYRRAGKLEHFPDEPIKLGSTYPFCILDQNRVNDVKYLRYPLPGQG